VKIVVSKEAMADIVRLRQFLQDKEPQAAQDATLALQNAIRSLEIFPGRGRPSGLSGVRELLVPFGRSAYLLRYGHDSARKTVIIIRVWHGREARE
jgi:toxin ParE1/3/4